MAFNATATSSGYGAPSPTTSHHAYPSPGFVNNPESALVPVPKPVPTLTPTAATVSNGSGQSQQSLSAAYTVAPKARKPNEKGTDDNLIDLDGLGRSLDK